MVSASKVFELIAHHTTDLICIHDAENIIRFATPSAYQILGYAPEDIIGKKLTDFLSQNFIDEMDFATLIRFFDHPGARIRYQVEHGKNELRWLETTFTYIHEGEDDEEEKSVLSSTRDITESVHLTDDLMDALSKEQEISTFKSNLYSIASHEFKTPLAVIQANIEVLKVKGGKRSIEKSLYAIEEEVDRLNTMIGDMLRLKKLATGKINFKPEPIVIPSLMEEIISLSMRKLYPDVQFKVSEISPEVISVDYTLMRYVFSNLIGNACKFSDSKGEVIIEYALSEDFFEVIVRDYGIGIPKAEQHEIFKSFYRASNAGHVQGTGVGLTLVSEFVALHGGRVLVESSLGKGSVFKVKLPRKL